MPDRQVKIAHLGTFDVANYGDLLFPLLARRRLRLVFPDLHMDFVSPAGSEPVWSDCVPALPWQDFADRIDFYDAILVGGGNIIRLSPTNLDVYRHGLTPLLAYAHLWADFAELNHTAVPVLWNAPGVPEPMPPTLVPLLRQAMTNVAYMAVRDEESRANAEPIAVGAAPIVVPDPAWDLPQMWRSNDLAAARAELWARSGREAPERVVTIHLNHRYLAGEAPQEVAARIDRFVHDRKATAVLIAIGPCHGDDELARDVGAAMQRAPLVLDAPGSLLEIAAMIAGADLYLGSSMHGFVTAMAFGVPALIVGSPRMTKFDGLLRGLGLPELRKNSWPEALDFAATAFWPELMARAASGVAAFAPRLDAHWDRIRGEVETRLTTPPTAPAARAIGLRQAVLGNTALGLLRDRERDRKRLNDLNVALAAQGERFGKERIELSSRIATLKAICDEQRRTSAEALARVRDLDRECDRQARELGTLAGSLREAQERYAKCLIEAKAWRTELKGHVAEEGQRRAAADEALAKAKTDLAQLEGRVAEALARIRDLERKRDGQAQELRTMVGHLRDAEERYQALTESSSWRLTAPLRRVSLKLRRAQVS